ncbi:TIGR01459 family HAD-type hydrolase [Kiloniella sp.]|uniref:TIGR01459 family HAD-type hydrolase n=1 Tax=Kiloniella sp. TaxID=1938587 RepID=UPI003B0260C6
MNIPILTGLSEIADDYDLFILDLWGVVHDGVTIYPGAAECLRLLRQRNAGVVLLSNAARPSNAIAAHLLKLGVKADMYDWLLTSGDVTANAVAAKGNGPKNNTQVDETQDHELGPAYFHLGPERCRPTLEACGGREVTLDNAELLICTGLIDEKTERVEDYAELLKSALACGLPMICANPDIVINRGGKVIHCAGALAAFYEKLGGTVERYGKPSQLFLNGYLLKALNFNAPGP